MRADLLALTADGLAVLANLGLVKRAQKDLAQGAGPTLSEDDATVVTGTFADGVVARLLPGMPLEECPCTCGAVTVCRHRVATALAYATWLAAGAGPGAAAATWSPGSLSDAVLAERLGRRTLDRAASLRHSALVEVLRPSALEPVPVARLATCTVRFLVAGDLAYATCDCEARRDCEHVALAVWAFRQADAAAPNVAVRMVELGASATEVAPATAIAEAAAVRAASSSTTAALSAAVGLATELLVAGVVNAGASLAQRFARVREGLAASRLAWPLDAVDALEGALAAYRRRSTLYRVAYAAELITELHARVRAAAAPGELPARAILGEGEALETRLDLVRLVALGITVETDGRDREVEVLLADPDGGNVLVLRKRFVTADGDEPRDALGLAGRRVASGVTLRAAAGGQIVSRVARRRANRVVAFGESRGGATSVTPQVGDWDRLPPPLLVRRLADLEASWRVRPPRLLRPRVVAEDVHVVAVAAVEDVAYLPGSQAIVATLRDAEGVPLRLVKPYRAVAPRALDAWAALLLGSHGPLRLVSGEVRRGAEGLEIVPFAASADRLVVPELADAPAVAVPVGRLGVSRDPLAEAVGESLSSLDEAAHHGLRFASAGARDRLGAAAARLERVGLRDCADRLRAAASAWASASVAATAEGWQGAAEAWVSASIRLRLLGDELGEGAG